jgi:hypothetical protein
MAHYTHPSQQGFSLIALSVILVVAMAIMASMLPGQDAGDYNQKTITNTQKLDAVEQALATFMTVNGRLPCPADGQYGIDDPNFGVEAASATGGCTGGTPAAPIAPDTTGMVVEGNIPTKNLGIANDYAFDELGRRFTYVADARATSTYSCYTLQQNIISGTATPGIQIQDATVSGNILDHVLHAYISHGPDGHGAWPAQGSTVAGRIDSHSTDTDTLTNAAVDSSFNTHFTNIKIKKDRTATFDDLVYYWDHTTYPKPSGSGTVDAKNTCCLGASCTANAPKGFRVDGVNVGDGSGYNVATGDINGDGITDLIIGAPAGAPVLGSPGVGHVYVVFGTRNGFPDPLPLSSLNGTNGFTINGITAGDDTGFAVASGDINGDGIADVLVGAINTNGNAGSAFIVFGGTGTWPASMNLSALNGSTGVNGTNGVEFDGEIRGSFLGNNVAAGDINGDGIQDFIVADNRASPGGATYVGSTYIIFGHKSAWTSPVNIPPLTDGTLIDGVHGFRVDGFVENSLSGTGLATGDVNGDGIADLIIGAPGAELTHITPGFTYVVFGIPAHGRRE